MRANEEAFSTTSQPENNMASKIRKTKAKPGVKFKDLKSKKNPKGGAVDTYMIGGDPPPTTTSTSSKK
jgi:hypothetical protein